MTNRHDWMTCYRTFCLVNSSRHLSVKIWADKSWPDDRQSGNSAWKSVVCGFNPSQTYCSLGTIFKDKDGQVMSNICPIWQVHNRKNDDTTLSLAIYVFGPSETAVPPGWGHRNPPSKTARRDLGAENGRPTLLNTAMSAWRKMFG